MAESLAASRSYQRLDELSESYRSHKSIDASGSYDLANFYVGVMKATVPDKIDDCSKMDLEFASEWVRRFPEAPSGYIVYAKMLLAKAWCIRGYGYVSTVQPAKMRIFSEMVASAESYLSDAPSSTRSDPEWFTTMAAIAQYEGYPSDTFMSIVMKGTANFSLYYPTYEVGMVYFLPEWGGSAEGDESYARWVVQRTQSLVGTDYYARLYLGLMAMIPPERLLRDKQVDAAMLRKSAEGLVDRYPVRRNYLAFARGLCKLHDPEGAVSVLERLGPRRLLLPWELAVQHGDCAGFSSIPDISPETRAALERRIATETPVAARR